MSNQQLNLIKLHNGRKSLFTTHVNILAARLVPQLKISRAWIQEVPDIFVVYFQVGHGNLKQSCAGYNYQSLILCSAAINPILQFPIPKLFATVSGKITFLFFSPAAANRSLRALTMIPGLS